MASDTLCGSHTGAEGEVANEGADCNSEHDPAIISHEE